LFRPERNEAVEQAGGFMPAVVVPDCAPAGSAPGGATADGTIEIEFAIGARMRVTGAVDSAALKAAVEALSGSKPR
jgi:transposase